MKTKARWWTAKPEIVTISFNSCWLFVMYLQLEPIRRSKYLWRVVKGLVDWSKGWFLVLAGTENGILSEFKGILSYFVTYYNYHKYSSSSTSAADLLFITLVYDSSSSSTTSPAVQYLYILHLQSTLLPSTTSYLPTTTTTSTSTSSLLQTIP